MDLLILVQDNATTLPTLPIEVIEEVIDQAGDERLPLRNLSLLCKPLLTRARFHLFTAIVIRNVEQMYLSREFLDSCPWILPLVRTVTLSVNVPDHYNKPSIPLLDIVHVHLLTRLPNLRAWTMRTENHGHWSQLSLHRSVLLCYRAYGGHIQNLVLARIPIQDVSHFAQLLSAFTSLRNLTCSAIWLRKEHQTPLHDAEIVRKLPKPPNMQHLSIKTNVDIRLVSYLLGSSLATLNSLTVILQLGAKPLYEAYFERFKELTSRLSELSSLTLVFAFKSINWGNHDNPEGAVQYIRWSTRLLERARIRGGERLRDVRVQFKLPTIAILGGLLSRGGPSLEASTALEDALLTFPAFDIQFRLLDRRRAGRSVFWSPTITSAFPKLCKLGLLTLPHAHPSDPLGHEDSVMCLVASPDSKWIVTGSMDGTLIVWDAECGKVTHEWLAHCGCVDALGFSPDSLRLVSAGGKSGETLVVWDISNGVNKVSVLASIDRKKYKETAVNWCAWSPDGTLIASACLGDGTVRTWDALTLQQRGLPVSAVDLETRGPRHAESFQWSPDSRSIAWRYAQGDGPARYHKWAIWSPLADAPPKRLPSHPTRPEAFFIGALSFDPESRHIATAIWKHTDADIGSSEGVSEGDGDSDGHSAYVQIWDVVSGTLLIVLGHAKVHTVSFSPNGMTLLSLSKDGSMKIWDTESWQETASLEGDGGTSESRMACFSPDGRYAATTSDDRVTDTYTVRLWRIGEALCTAVFIEHKTTVTCLAFSRNGEFLASGDAEGIVHMRRLSNFIGH